MKENKYIRNVSISKEGTNNKQTMFPASFCKLQSTLLLHPPAPASPATPQAASYN